MQASDLIVIRGFSPTCSKSIIRETPLRTMLIKHGINDDGNKAWRILIGCEIGNPVLSMQFGRKRDCEIAIKCLLEITGGNDSLDAVRASLTDEATMLRFLESVANSLAW